MSRRNLRYICFLALWAIGPSQAAPRAVAHNDFVPVQPDTFKTPGAFSNAWADFDGDGDSDLAVSLKSGEVRLYRNDRQAFVSVGPDLGLSMKGAEARALAWADFDADGDLDLYVGAQDKVYLMRNDRSAGFKDVAAELGIAPGKITSRQSTWVDFDLDGDLDLHLANRSAAGPDFLYRNEGGRFVEVAAEAGLADARRAVGACWFDMDQDGDLDVFVAHQDGDTDAVYRNERGKFTDIAAALKMDRADRKGQKDVGSVGCTVGDYDNDGDLDMFVATYGQSMLYRNDDGRFTDVASSAGILAQGHAVGASWGDYDNDGDLDLYVTNYHGEKGAEHPATYLFQSSQGRFENVLRSNSVVNAADHGVQWVDHDRDGDLDLSLTRGYTTEGGSPVFRNELDKRARGRSLQVLVVDPFGRQTCTGAEVRLFDRTGRLLGTRLVMSGDGYDAQSAGPVHFGLARADSVVVEVTYLTATGRVTQRIEGIDPQKHRAMPLVVRQR